VNLQIFGTKKSSDTRKAERFFKERGVKYQYIDLNEKGLSRGELSGVCRAVGGAEKLIDENCRDADALALVKYISAESREDMLLRNQQVLRQPIVRSGRQATVGYCPEVWKEWIKNEK